MDKRNSSRKQLNLPPIQNHQQHLIQQHRMFSNTNFQNQNQYNTITTNNPSQPILNENFQRQINYNINNNGFGNEYSFRCKMSGDVHIIWNMGRA